MILRNHGALTAGTTVPDAFEQLYYLERACDAQVKALARGTEVIVCADDVAESMASVLERPQRKGH